MKIRIKLPKWIKKKDKALEDNGYSKSFFTRRLINNIIFWGVTILVGWYMFHQINVSEDQTTKPYWNISSENSSAQQTIGNLNGILTGNFSIIMVIILIFGGYMFLKALRQSGVF